MRIGNYFRIALIALLLFALALAVSTCGGGNKSRFPRDLAVPTQPATEMAATPQVVAVKMQPEEPQELPFKGVSWLAPSELQGLLPPPKEVAWAPEGLIRTGADYDELLPNNRVSTESVPNAVFAPDYVLGTSSWEDLSYAIYRFSLESYDEEPEQTVAFEWDTPPADYNNFWVAFGDIEVDSWRWYEGPADNVLTIESYAPYIAEDGSAFIVVLLIGSDECSLSEIRVGDPEIRGLGCVPEVAEGDTTPPLACGMLSRSKDLTPGCSPVNDQGWVASCTAFAIGDGAYNYELMRIYGAYGWDFQDPFNLVSPKYLYVETGKAQGLGCPNEGRRTDESVRWLVTNGIATELNAPYGNPSPPPLGWCGEVWSEEALNDAALLNIESFTSFSPASESGVLQVKTIIASQERPVILSIGLDTNFMYYQSGVWNYTGPVVGYHAMLIVGYDDSKDGGYGAFKVRNSWGRDWGMGGYVWIGYRTFFNYPSNMWIWCNTLKDEYDPAVAERFCRYGSELLPPTDVAASDGTFTDRIQVTWLRSEEATGYKVYRDSQSNLVATLGDVASWDDMAVDDYLGHVYWVRAFNALRESSLSAPDTGFLAQAPTIFGVTPLLGITGKQVTFVPSVSGSQPLTFAWNFGGGATPNISAEARPTVTLGSPGSYNALLVVSNAYGYDQYWFDLMVYPEPTYSVSGTVTKSTGGGLQNVTLTLMPGGYSATTNSSGNYTITGIPNGSYTLTPNMSGWWFSPTSRSVTVSGGNVTGRNFTAIEPTYSVSGTVTKNTGGVLQNVTLTLTPGGYSATTNSSGNYTITGVPNGSYTLTPSLSWWLFSPTSLSVTVSGGNVTGKNFTAIQNAFAVFGTVTKNTGGSLQNTTLTLTPGGYSATTNSSGNYTIVGVPNGDYTLTPSLSGWSFSPTSLSVTMNNGDVTGKNFMASDAQNPTVSVTAPSDGALYNVSDSTLFTAIASDNAGVTKVEFYIHGSLYHTDVTAPYAAPDYTFVGEDVGQVAFMAKAYDAANNTASDTNAVTVNEPQWHIYIPESAGNVGRYTSLAVVNGYPAISYCDDTNHDLKYVRATNANGSSWGTPVTVDSAGSVGQWTSLAVVNGNPAISYHYYSYSDLRYVRATDANGSSWGTPVTVDSAGSVGEWTSLAVLGTNVPAISYYDMANYAIKYVRATDANGSSWGTPVEPVGEAPLSGYSGISLAVVYGTPAISYFTGASADLNYVRATNAGGSSWGSPDTVDSAGSVGMYTSLAVVNGNPAISYFKGTNGDLKYVRTADSGSWGTPVTVDSAGNVGQWTSLAVVDGCPAISYYDYYDHDLKYVRATDANGSSWGTPVTVDAAGDVGMYTSLAVVNGHPVISYYDATNKDLKFAIFY